MPLASHCRSSELNTCRHEGSPHIHIVARVARKAPTRQANPIPACDFSARLWECVHSHTSLTLADVAVASHENSAYRSVPGGIAVGRPRRSVSRPQASATGNLKRMIAAQD